MIPLRRRGRRKTSRPEGKRDGTTQKGNSSKSKTWYNRHFATSQERVLKDGLFLSRSGEIATTPEDFPARDQLDCLDLRRSAREQRKMNDRRVQNANK